MTRRALRGEVHASALPAGLKRVIIPVHEWQAKVTWDDVARMRDYAGLPFVLKGIMSPEDATLAVQHGVDAV